MSEAIQVGLFGEVTELRRAAVKERLAKLALSEPLESPLLRILSLGMGLQSVTLAFMSARGDLPMIDYAIFADTGHEKRATYEYLDYLRERVPFPILVERAPRDTLGDYAKQNVSLPLKGRSQLPFHTLAPDGKKGMLPKQCNSDWKKRVVHRAIARLIRERTGQQHPGGELAPIGQGDADLLPALDDVVVGDDDPVGPHDHARAQGLGHPLARDAEAEHLPEGIDLLALAPGRIDVHDGGGRALHDGGEGEPDRARVGGDQPGRGRQRLLLHRLGGGAAGRVRAGRHQGEERQAEAAETHDRLAHGS